MFLVVLDIFSVFTYEKVNNESLIYKKNEIAIP